MEGFSDIDIDASVGVVARELPVETGNVDHLLFVDEQAAGVI